MRRMGAIVLAVLLLAGQARANPHLDGNWWMAQDDSAKTGYLIGLGDGVQLGNSFTVGTDGQPGPAYTAAYNRYLAGVDNPRILEAIDAFYSDPQARRVTFPDALMAVLKQIAGDPDADAFVARIKAAASAR